MSGVDRAATVRLVEGMINSNRIACTECLSASLSAEGDVADMFKSLADLFASNARAIAHLNDQLLDAWGLIDFKADIDKL